MSYSECGETAELEVGYCDICNLERPHYGGEFLETTSGKYFICAGCINERTKIPA